MEKYEIPMPNFEPRTNEKIKHLFKYVKTEWVWGGKLFKEIIH